MFTITGDKNHDNALFRKFGSHLRTCTKRVKVFNSIVLQEKNSSRDTLPFIGYYRTVRALQTHVLSSHNRVLSASHTAPTAGGLSSENK
jgi:hypothetical protein